MKICRRDGQEVVPYYVNSGGLRPGGMDRTVQVGWQCAAGHMLNIGEEPLVVDDEPEAT